MVYQLQKAIKEHHVYIHVIQIVSVRKNTNVTFMNISWLNPTGNILKCFMIINATYINV